MKSLDQAGVRVTPRPGIRPNTSARLDPRPVTKLRFRLRDCKRSQIPPVSKALLPVRSGPRYGNERRLFLRAVLLPILIPTRQVELVVIP